MARFSLLQYPKTRMLLHQGPLNADTKQTSTAHFFMKITDIDFESTPFLWLHFEIKKYPFLRFLKYAWLIKIEECHHRVDMSTGTWIMWIPVCIAF